MDKKYQICKRCVMDNVSNNLKFDKDGICVYCGIHDKLESEYPLNEIGKKRLELLIKIIKEKGKQKEYDCIVGVSGGRDSTYTLLTVKKMGLRPLAVHFDNGWNSDIAVSNIKKATEILNVDLETWVADWEEFKSLQLAFLKASVSDAEIPTDYAITSVLYKIANDMGIKYILNGCSFRTEGIAPLEWTYMDGRYINHIFRKFSGKNKIKSFPIMSMFDLIIYSIKGIKTIHLLQYFDYHQEGVDKMLEKEVGWKYYGGHHHESTFTEFFQSYYLPTKFNIDKRKMEYSALIRSGQKKRQDALDEIKNNPYPYKPEVIDYAISKLGINKEEFEIIMKNKNKSFKDYKSYYNIIKIMRIPIKIAVKMKILPDLFYEKYFAY